MSQNHQIRGLSDTLALCIKIRKLSYPRTSYYIWITKVQILFCLRYNKECASAHSSVCGVTERQWRSSSNDRSETETLATSSLYAVVRILPEAFLWACEKTRVFSCVLLLMDVIVVILHKKGYSSPYPIRMLLWNPMRQLHLFSVCCDIYKDCVR